MAFSITDAKLYKVEVPNATKRYGLQGVELKVARGAAGDVDFDVGDTAGTFWTDAVAAAGNAGSLASAVLVEFGKIHDKVDGLVSLELVANNGPMLRVASASAATNYDLSNAGTYPLFEPDISLFNDAAPATITLRMVLSLTDETETVEYSY